MKTKGILSIIFICFIMFFFSFNYSFYLFQLKKMFFQFYSHPFYLEFIRSLNLSWREGCSISPYPGPALSSALMFDGVHVVVSAVRELNRSQEIGVKPLSCTSPLIWQHGTSLMNYLRMVEYDGLTGHIEFNSKGQRTNYTLKILEKHPGGHKEIGIWYSNNTLAMNSTSLDLNASETLANKTLIVTTILENPYVMRKSKYQDFHGNDQYEGFCVDMLRELADILKFSFKIKLVDDGLYGAPEPNGSWTGMVGELINRKADLAVAGFTITSEREKVIDFSKPFMTLGISILYRVHLGRKPGYFSFLDPFSPAVWLFMLLAYLAVSCVLFLAARLSPYEWYNPHPCLRERRDILENQYTLGNSLWFPVGGFMQQGSEIMPRALSTRCVSGVWYVFANAAAALQKCPLTNLMFSHILTYSNTMSERLSVVSSGSPYRDEITLGILQLQESNRLEILKRRWWEGGQCPKEEDHRAKGLGMENIGGIFVVLICGLIIAVFVAIMEFVWSTRRSAETDEVSVCQEMLTEFRNAVSCKKSSRSRRRRPLSGAGGGILRHPSRLALAAPRPIRLVREMRLSNGKLYSGTGPLTGGLGLGPDLGPGPQRLLEDPLGANASSTPCSHVRICQECRRIQSLRPAAALTPPPPPPPSSSSSTSSCSRIPPSMATPGHPHHHRHNPHHHLHYHHGSMSLPRLPPPPPPIASDRADSDGGGGAPSPRRGKPKPAPPPRPQPPTKTPTHPTTDLLGGHD
uniref:Glutamate receptor, ionotropic, kainate 5 n=1 Tax=Sphaeramia orbicularis TaxID=375764 RepID=A0A672YRW1_9TELE